MNTEIKEVTKEQAWELRHQVMWPSEPFDYIKVAGDDSALHYGLFKADSLISVVSLFINQQEAQFRKFATAEQEQNRGFGSALLSFILEQAKNHGIQRIWCNARTNKMSFYKKFGLVETDTYLTRGNKEYVIMEKHLL